MIFIPILLSLIGLANTGKEHIGGACHDPLHFGTTPCDSTWSIRYHLDVPTETCLAFNFTGCGQNWNNFETSLSCYEECLPLDHQICPAASTIYKTTKGQEACDDDCDCGPGRYCNLGHGYGQCCDQSVKDKVESDYNPKCPTGKKVVEYRLNGVTMKLVGKNCSHNFCPLDATCHDGHFFAACCQ